jgi:hypothetical protein
MFTSRSLSAALGAACLSLAVVSTALASGPATVTVRVEGLSETKLPSTQVTTTATPVVKDGNPEHACSGTSALGALELGTRGSWSGPWNSGFKQYEIYSIEGETHLFEPESSANYYWSLWIDEKEAFVGACEAELTAGDRVLFFPACFGSACPPPMSPLGIQAPASANVGEPISVTVTKYASGGEAAAAPGATVAGAGANATTDAAGNATLAFSHAGLITLAATAPDAVRTETTVCVHAGSDGSCGTRAPSGTAAPSSSGTPTGSTNTGGVASFVGRYTGPFALVASATGLLDGHVYARGRSPRVLSGNILAHSPVSAVSLELRRRYRGICSAYDGVSERFRRASCGSGSFFRVSSTGVFSYLLPAALGPGRYVLDVQASDVAGNRTTLARGTSRLVFYVR